MPSDFSRRIRSSTLCTSRTASAAVGSSMMTSFGLKVSARAIATVCCWPPENEPTERLIDGRCAPSRSIIFAAWRSISALSTMPGNEAEQLLGRLAAEEDVAGHVLLLGQRQVLIDHLDAELAPLAGIELQDVVAVEGRSSRNRRGRCR